MTNRKMAVWLTLTAIAIIIYTFALQAFAQQDVIVNGIDSSNNIQRLRTDSSGNLASSSTHAACTCTTTTVGTSSTTVPTSPLAGRTTIAWQVLTSGNTVTCRNDDVAATSLGAGLTGGYLDILKDNLTGTVNLRCAASAASTTVAACECP